MKDKKLWALLCGLVLAAGSMTFAGCPEEDDDDDLFDKGAKVEQVEEVRA